jgi:uncharacterized GH25 family protein
LDTELGFQQQEVHTDSEGRFELHNVTPGRWRILIEARQLAAAWTEIVASAAKPVQNQFVLEPGDSIGGKVVDTTGKPVAGASVRCAVPLSGGPAMASELPLQTSTLTDEDGSFRLGPLPPGQVRLTAELESRRLVGDVVVERNRADVVVTVAEEVAAAP